MNKNERENFDGMVGGTYVPLAERLRPRTLDEFIGQEHLVGKGKVLRRLIDSGLMTSCIFFGPPGTGKTTLASIISNVCGGKFVKLNAVTSGVADAKRVIEDAKRDLELYGKKTYLLLDECHRWSKAQSDSVLAAIEKGYITFIGSTTESPFYSMTRAIVSRCKVFEFKPLSIAEVKKALAIAITDEERGYGNRNIELKKEALDQFALNSSGDIRSALGALELAVTSTKPDKSGKIVIDAEIAAECTGGKLLSLDENEFYDMLSAFCKSLRGSDPSAACYWAMRMIEGGIDPEIIIRRTIAHASEDVGLANNDAMITATSALVAYKNLGAPEGLLPMTQAIIKVATSKKSNSVVMALNSAKDLAKKTYRSAVPDHLKNYNFMNEKRAKYKYPHDYGGYVKQQYLPDELIGTRIYQKNKNDIIDGGTNDD